MKINFPTFHSFVEDLHSISVGETQHILARHWCGPMNVKSLCTEDCSNCADHLRKAFQFEDAKKPQALLIWMLRNELAAVQEEQSIHEFVPVKDAFGSNKPTSEHILTDLAGRYK